MATTITTASGTEYHINRSITQEVYVRWEDVHYDGPEGMQGGRIKIIEHIKVAEVPCVGGHLHFVGTERYTGSRFYWKTSTIVKIVRNGVEIQSMTDPQ